MSDSVQPHRRQTTRLPHPQDSPGKNTRVGCHFLLQCMKVKSESEVAQSCPTHRPHGLQPTRLLHGNFQARVLECLDQMSLDLQNICLFIHKAGLLGKNNYRCHRCCCCCSCCCVLGDTLLNLNFIICQIQI